MNTFNKISAVFLILTGLAFMSGCVKGDFDTPPVVVPKVDFSANTTISQLLAMYTGGVVNIDSNVIVKGLVVANDESGNFYKQIIIEDDSSGLQIQIDKKDLYTTYKLGQRVYVKCDGLALGEYGGNLQLGYNVGGVISRIPAAQLETHLFLDSLPGLVPDPKPVTIPTLSTTKLNMLVKFDSLHFTEPGLTFANTNATTNRNLSDQLGNIIILRTSNYATFQSSLMPTGIGSVTGVLSIFNSDWQLFIRDLNDLQGFDQ
ncbi:MAG: DUF5689 domain-containing protein [Bacteroidales bacterium]|nr:DUF5689 domain-containing protein [Bacteroidales bacterium]